MLGTVPDARLCFVGPDPGLVDDRGRRWDLAGFVDDRLPGARAVGPRPPDGQAPALEPGRAAAEAMITVVCSRYEVFCIAAIEAMAMGCPLVASRVGGIPEIIRDGVDGLLHRGGDPEDLAAKILALLGDPARAAELGRRAAAHCEQQFNPVTIASRMVDYYRRVLADDPYHPHRVRHRECARRWSSSP